MAARPRHTDDDDFAEFGREMDRMWIYRITQVEQLGVRNAADIKALTEAVDKLIAGMPAAYVPRKEHEQKRETRMTRIAVLFTAINVVATPLLSALARHL